MHDVNESPETDMYTTRKTPGRYEAVDGGGVLRRKNEIGANHVRHFPAHLSPQQGAAQVSNIGSFKFASVWT